MPEGQRAGRLLSGAGRDARSLLIKSWALVRRQLTRRRRRRSSTWLAGQDETVKGLLNQHTQGLKSAAGSRNAPSARISASSSKICRAKPRKARIPKKALTDACSNKISQAERRAAFAEEAITPGVGCLNVKAAYASGNN